MDIYPTLVEVLGAPERKDIEGQSLVPLLKNPAAPRKEPALTTYGRANHSIRSENWRYIRYSDGGEELYDEKNDPNEWTNLAAKPEHAAVKRELAAWLPKSDAVEAPTARERPVDD
jgi:arylsulfatase A-like enzyme